MGETCIETEGRRVVWRVVKEGASQIKGIHSFIQPIFLSTYYVGILDLTVKATSKQILKVVSSARGKGIENVRRRWVYL